MSWLFAHRAINRYGFTVAASDGSIGATTLSIASLTKDSKGTKS